MPITTSKTIAITFDPTTKVVSCPNRVELSDGEDVEWTLSGATTFYLQFVEISLRRGGAAAVWPFREGDARRFRADPTPASGRFTTKVVNPGPAPRTRVFKYTVVVVDDSGAYTLDPAVVIDPM